MGAFRHRSLARTGLSLAVAFVLALQMLLAGAVSASMAAPANASFDTVLCATGHDSSAQKTDVDRQPAADHNRCDVCALASAAGLVPVLASVSRVAAVVSLRNARFDTLSLSDERHLPRTSQGPPKAA